MICSSYLQSNVGFGLSLGKSLDLGLGLGFWGGIACAVVKRFKNSNRLSSNDNPLLSEAVLLIKCIKIGYTSYH